MISDRTIVRGSSDSEINGGRKGKGHTGKRFNKHINTFVPKLVSTGSEEVQSVVQVEVVMTIEMTSDEIINLFLSLNVEILEFVHCCEFLDVQTVGQDTIWLLA